MIATWFRRAALVLACASGILLAGCGSSTVESALVPSRFLAVGDAMSDLGQSGARYTVNDGSVSSNWTEQLAGRYGQTLTASSGGGRSYAQAHARVLAATDAVGGSAPSISAQIDSLLAANQLGEDDVVLVQGGISDIIAIVASGSADMGGAARQAGRDLAAQVRRLVDAGAKHVLLVGPYNLGQSPWAAISGQRALLRSLSETFNQGLLGAAYELNLGENVLYVDASYYFNLVTAYPGNYAFSNDPNNLLDGGGTAPKPACASVGAGVGIGIGTGQVNAALCTPSTLAAGVTDYNRSVFADGVYFTPNAQRLLGNYAYDRLRTRW